MNRREANDLREVLTMLEHGPGQGWRALLEGGAGGEQGADGKGLEMRLADFNLWRDTWIRPVLARLVARYWRPGRVRALAPGGIRPESARLLESLREGERRQVIGEESPAFWMGYYGGIARRAIDRLEELEAREARS